MPGRLSEYPSYVFLCAHTLSSRDRLGGSWTVAQHIEEKEEISPDAAWSFSSLSGYRSETSAALGWPASVMVKNARPLSRWSSSSSRTVRLTKAPWRVIA